MPCLAKLWKAKAAPASLVIADVSHAVVKLALPTLFFAPQAPACWLSPPLLCTLSCWLWRSMATCHSSCWTRQVRGLQQHCGCLGLLADLAGHWKPCTFGCTRRRCARWKLINTMMCPLSCVCVQLGVVHEWLGRPEKMQFQLVEATAARCASTAEREQVPAAGREASTRRWKHLLKSSTAAATSWIVGGQPAQLLSSYKISPTLFWSPPPAPFCRLLYWAVASGLPATAGLLLSVLQSQSGGSAAAAAGVLQRALQPEAAAGAVSGALARMDGLAQLHLSIQATSAAAMQRAAEVRQQRVWCAMSAARSLMLLCNCVEQLVYRQPYPSSPTFLPCFPLTCPAAGGHRRLVAAAPRSSVGLCRHAARCAGLG